MAYLLSRLRRMIVGLCLCWALTTILILLPPPISPLVPWNLFLTGKWSDAQGDTLIVLGADAVADHLLGLHSYWRTAYAVYEWRQGHYRRIVFSGKDLSGPMRDFAIAHGVPAAAIECEDVAITTREQAERVAAMLRRSSANPTGRIILLTSDFHSRRATATFRRLGVPVEPRPVPDAGKRLNDWSLRWNVFLDLSLETTKTIYYQWHGWLG